MPPRFAFLAAVVALGLTAATPPEPSTAQPTEHRFENSSAVKLIGTPQPAESLPHTRVAAVPKPGQSGYQDQDPESLPAPSDTETFTFQGPAYFPIARFLQPRPVPVGLEGGLTGRWPEGEVRSPVPFAIDPAFCPSSAVPQTFHDDAGATILEGMAVEVRPNGSYTVRFLVEAPAMPVTLRLQFLVHAKNRVGRITSAGPGREASSSILVQAKNRVGRITLPPITVIPRTGSDNEPEANTFRVEHRGYSPFLADAKVTVPLVHLEFQRLGTARFGSGVPPAVIGFR